MSRAHAEVTQDPVDILIEEYRDASPEKYETTPERSSSQFELITDEKFNKSAYSLTFSEKPGQMKLLAQKLSTVFNDFFHDTNKRDLQIHEPGTANLLPSTPVVRSQTRIMVKGLVKDAATNSKKEVPLDFGFGPTTSLSPHDDCEGIKLKSLTEQGTIRLCDGIIVAGADGVADSRANDLVLRRVDLSAAVTSGSGNPRRNRFEGSKSDSSFHVRGVGIDVGILTLRQMIQSLDWLPTPKLVCALTMGAQQVVRGRKSFPDPLLFEASADEAGSFVSCDDPTISHVHLGARE